jgi:hypothetical protein
LKSLSFADREGVSIPLPKRDGVDLEVAACMVLKISHTKLVYSKRWIDEWKAISISSRAPLDRDNVWCSGSMLRRAAFDHMRTRLEACTVVVVPTTSTSARMMVLNVHDLSVRNQLVAAPCSVDGDGDAGGGQKHGIQVVNAPMERNHIDIRGLDAILATNVPDDLLPAVTCMNLVREQQKPVLHRSATKSGIGPARTPVQSATRDVHVHTMAPTDHQDALLHKWQQALQLHIDQLQERLSDDLNLAPSTNHRSFESFGADTAAPLLPTFFPRHQSFRVVSISRVALVMDQAFGSAFRAINPLAAANEIRIDGGIEIGGSFSQLSLLQTIVQLNSKEPSATMHLPPDYVVETLTTMRLSSPGMKISTEERVAYAHRLQTSLQQSNKQQMVVTGVIPVASQAPSGYVWGIDPPVAFSGRPLLLSPDWKRFGAASANAIAQYFAHIGEHQVPSHLISHPSATSITVPSQLSIGAVRSTGYGLLLPNIMNSTASDPSAATEASMQLTAGRWTSELASLAVAADACAQAYSQLPILEVPMAVSHLTDTTLSVMPSARRPVASTPRSMDRGAPRLAQQLVPRKRGQTLSNMDLNTSSAAALAVTRTAFTFNAQESAELVSRVSVAMSAAEHFKAFGTVLKRTVAAADSSTTEMHAAVTAMSSSQAKYISIIQALMDERTELMLANSALEDVSTAMASNDKQWDNNAVNVSDADRFVVSRLHQGDTVTAEALALDRPTVHSAFPWQERVVVFVAGFVTAIVLVIAILAAIPH